MAREDSVDLEILTEQNGLILDYANAVVKEGNVFSYQKPNGIWIKVKVHKIHRGPVNEQGNEEWR